MRKLSRGLLKAEILLWNMGTGLKEKWRRAAQDESGLDVIITVALIAVMLIVAGLVVKLLGRVLEPTGTSVGNFLRTRLKGKQDQWNGSLRYAVPG